MRYNNRRFANDFNTLVPVLDNLFGNPIKRHMETDSVRNVARPKANIVEFEDHLDIILALPGFTKDAISIKVEDKNLVVTGNLEKSEDQPKYKHKEWEMSTFERKFSLSDRLDQEAIKAVFDNGLLTLSIAKVKEAQPRTITIL